MTQVASEKDKKDPAFRSYVEASNNIPRRYPELCRLWTIAEEDMLVGDNEKEDENIEDTTKAKRKCLCTRDQMVEEMQRQEEEIRRRELDRADDKYWRETQRAAVLGIAYVYRYMPSLPKIEIDLP